MTTHLPAKRKPKRIPKKVKGAIDAILEGRAKNKAEAAVLMECSRAYISREMDRPHIAAYFRDRIARAVTLTAGRGAARLGELVDDPRSAHVSLEASKFALGVIGISPKADVAALSLNVNLPRAGWIINLTDPDKPNAPEVRVGSVPSLEPEIIDVTPNKDD